MGYTLLINETVRNELNSASPSVRRRIKEKLQLLELGLWDTGVKAKKLTGSGRQVFEARLDRRHRFLFDLVREPGRERTIRIWQISHHDDVNRVARSKALPQNAPFLALADVMDTPTEELDELVLDDIPVSYYHQQNAAYNCSDHGPQQWGRFQNQQDWDRAFASDSIQTSELRLYLDPAQEQVLAHPLPCCLTGTGAGSGKTTLALYTLLRPEFVNEPRLFVTYSPTLAEELKNKFRRLVSSAPGTPKYQEPEFYSYRALLRHINAHYGKVFEEDDEVSFERFADIYNQHDLSGRYDPSSVWLELRSFVKGAAPPIPVAHFARMVQEYKKGASSTAFLAQLGEYILSLRDYDFADKIEKTLASLAHTTSYTAFIVSLTKERTQDIRVLDQILKIVNTRLATAQDRPLLSLQEYLAISPRRAPNFSKAERKDVYAIIDYYQKVLAEEGLHDELEMTRSALKFLRSKPYTPFSLVVGDEVQDLVAHSLHVLMALLKTPQNVFLTGDISQSIHPSAWSWSYVTDYFYERGHPAPAMLRVDVNHRSDGSLVELGNSFIGLKGRLLGLQEKERRERYTYSGQYPILVSNVSAETFLDRFRVEGANQAVIAPDQKTCAELRKKLKSSFVFTLAEIKGMEWDCILVWNLYADKTSQDLWRRIDQNQSVEPRQAHALRQMLNSWYCAATRPRRVLVIFDGSGESYLWKQPEFEGKLLATDDMTEVSEAWRTLSTDEDWDAQGQKLLSRELFAAAAESFRNANNTLLEELATAYHVHDIRDMDRMEWAADIFSNSGIPGKAAAIYEDLGRFEAAKTLWEAVGDNKKARICEALLLAQKKRHHEAAELYLACDCPSKALEEVKLSGNMHMQAELHKRLGNPGEAGRAYLVVKDFENAAEQFLAAESYEAAGDAFWSANRYAEAAECFHKAENFAKASAALEACGDFVGAADAITDRDPDRAVSLLRKFASESEKNEMQLYEERDELVSAGSVRYAAVRTEALGAQEEAVRQWLACGEIIRATRYAQRLGDHLLQARCHRKAGNHYDAALLFAKYRDFHDLSSACVRQYILGSEKPVSMQELMSSPERVKQKRYERMSKKAIELAHERLFDQALPLAKGLLDFNGVSYCYEELDESYIDDALLFFAATDYPQGSAALLNQKRPRSVRFSTVCHLCQLTISHIGDPSIRHEQLKIIYPLFEVLLTRQDDENTPALIDAFVSELFPYGDWLATEFISDAFCKILVRNRFTNPLISLIHNGKLWKKPETLPWFNPLHAELRNVFEEEKDPELGACSAYMTHTPEAMMSFENFLGQIPIREGNYKLFAFSKSHFSHAVDFLPLIGEDETADYILRMQEPSYQKNEEGSDPILLNLSRKEPTRRLAKTLEWLEKMPEREIAARVYQDLGYLRSSLKEWKQLENVEQVARLERQIDSNIDVKLLTAPTLFQVGSNTHVWAVTDSVGDTLLFNRKPVFRSVPNEDRAPITFWATDSEDEEQELSLVIGSALPRGYVLVRDIPHKVRLVFEKTSTSEANFWLVEEDEQIRLYHPYKPVYIEDAECWDILYDEAGMAEEDCSILMPMYVFPTIYEEEEPVGVSLINMIPIPQ